MSYSLEMNSKALKNSPYKTLLTMILLALVSSYTHPPNFFEKVGTLHFPKNETLEFRTLCRCLNHKEPQRWFASFGNLKKKIAHLTGNHESSKAPEVSGVFYHNNLNGPSYEVSLTSQVKEKLGALVKNSPLTSIWDYVHCDHVSLDLMFSPTSFNYQLLVTHLEECRVED